jgi:putative ABC transport system substrate-binding protein
MIVRRRDFASLLCGAAAWPLAAQSQQRKVPVIGYLDAHSSKGWEPYSGAFLHGLRETGFVERQNVTIEYRWSEDQDDRMPELAAGLVRLGVDVIAMSGSATGALAVKAAAPKLQSFSRWERTLSRSVSSQA